MVKTRNRIVVYIVAGMILQSPATRDSAVFCPACAQDVNASISSSTPDEQELGEFDQYPGHQLRAALDARIASLESELQRDSKSATAYAELADTRIMLWCFGFLPHEQTISQAEREAAQALELNSQLAAAHTALGVVAMSNWQWPDAEREFRLSIQQAPDRALSHHWYALYLAAMNRHDEALTESQTAITLEPSSGMRTGLGAVLYFGREYPRMIREMRHIVAEDPSFGPGYDWLGMAYIQTCRFEEGIAAYRQAVEHTQGLAEVVAGLGHAYARAGRRSEAREVLENLLTMSKQWHIPPVQIAYVHIGLGEYGAAFARLEQAAREHSWELAFLQVEPWFDDIRDDPRFVDLEAKLAFPAHGPSTGNEASARDGNN